MADALEDRLEALSKLSAGDRKAVLARLSEKERRVLDALRTLAASPSPAPRPAAALPKKVLAPCSPWLAKRIAQILDEKSAKALVTPGTRDALYILVAGGGAKS